MTGTKLPGSFKKTSLRVKERSGGVCEACGMDRGEHVHHRKLRSQGGDNQQTNLIYVSAACHDRIHMNPKDSYELGLLVHSYDDPALIPVRLLVSS